MQTLEPTSPRVVTPAVDTPAAEQFTTASEEALVRELVSKSTYESGCLRPINNGTTRKDLHVRVDALHELLPPNCTCTPANQSYLCTLALNQNMLSKVYAFIFPMHFSYRLARALR